MSFTSLCTMSEELRRISTLVATVDTLRQQVMDLNTRLTLLTEILRTELPDLDEKLAARANMSASKNAKDNLKASADA